MKVEGTCCGVVIAVDGIKKDQRHALIWDHSDAKWT